MNDNPRSDSAPNAKATRSVLSSTIFHLLNDTAGLFGLRRTSDLFSIDNQIISGSSLGSIRCDTVNPKAIRCSWFQIDGFSFRHTSFRDQCCARGWCPVLFESLIFQLVLGGQRDRFELHRDGRLQTRKTVSWEKWLQIFIVQNNNAIERRVVMSPISDTI